MVKETEMDHIAGFLTLPNLSNEDSKQMSRRSWAVCTAPYASMRPSPFTCQSEGAHSGSSSWGL